MRYLIYISIFLASVFCFFQGQAQGVSMFGASRAQDTSKTKAQIVAPVYATSDTNKVLGVDATGHFVLRSKTNTPTIDTTQFLKYSDTSRSGIVTTYWYVDSLYSTIGTHDSLVKYSDSNSVYVTTYGLDTAKANLRTSISAKVNYSDSAGFLPTKTFLANNYFANGGNTFGATATLGTNGSNALDFETNNTVRSRIFSNGNMAVGTTTDGGFKFDVSGTGRFSGNLTAGGATLIRSDAILLTGLTSTMIKRSHDYGGGVLSGMHIGAIEAGGVGWPIYLTSSSSAGWYQSFASTGSILSTTGLTVSNFNTRIPSSILELRSTTQLFYPPRMTTAQRNAISSPQAGGEIYCTDCTATDGSTGVKQTYNGTTWKNHW